MTRLTLKVEEAVAKKAKRIAEQRETTVSALFAAFIQDEPESRRKRPPIGPITRMLSGIASMPEGKTDRELLEEALMEKYDIKP